MRVVSFVSCIWLSIFVILILSLGVQATEYREVNTEVNASNISTHIENGDDIYLDNCQIVGELNVSKMKLGTVPDPVYHDFFKKVWSKKTLIFFGVNENISEVKSNIKIQYSNFNDSVDFSGSTFNDSVDFSGSTFNDSVDFSRSTFNESADFSGSTFNESADFSGSTFNAPAKFDFVVDRDSADFNFNNKLGIIFTYGTDFKEFADFSSATFNAHVDFFAVFQSRADFSGSTFNDSVDFSKSSFYDSVDFSRSTFNESADFFGSTFNESAGIKGPERFKNILIDNGKTCDLFMRYYKNEARYTDADNIYFDYRINVREKLTLFQKLIDVLSWVTCGYGVRLSHTIGCIVVILLFFSLLHYWMLTKFYRLSDAAEKKSKLSHLEPILISIRGFTMMGSDRYSKNDLFRIFIAVEGLIGWIMLGIFMATLTNLLMRS